jgi:hypothetical protein
LARNDCRNDVNATVSSVIAQQRGEGERLLVDRQFLVERTRLMRRLGNGALGTGPAASALFRDGDLDGLLVRGLVEVRSNVGECVHG